MRHPRKMGIPEIEAFLSHLATERKIGRSTQNQAFNALLFLYKEGLRIPLEDPINALRAPRRQRIPVVMTIDETQRVLEAMSGAMKTMAQLMYGSGLRLIKCARLRGQNHPRTGPGGGFRTGFPASGPGEEISLRRKAMDLAVCLPGPEPFAGSPLERGPAAPHPPHSVPKSPGPSRPVGGDQQAGDQPHLPTQLCHPPAGRWVRHPDHLGVFGPRRRLDHDDLHRRLNKGGQGVRSPLDSLG